MTAIFQGYCNSDGKLRVDLNPPGTTFDRGMAVNPIALAVHATLNGTIVAPGNGAYIPSPGFIAPLKNSLVLDRGTGDPTFTRASIATVVDFEGLIKNVISGEARFTGARRVFNGLALTSMKSADLTTISSPAADTTATTYTSTGVGEQLTIGLNSGDWAPGKVRLTRVRFVISGTPGDTVNVAVSNAAGSIYTALQITLTATPTTYSLQNASEDSAFTYWWFRNDAVFGLSAATASLTVTLTDLQIENVLGQSNQNPSEYVSVGVESAPYHGAGVDGVKYFTTENGNTVASNVVTEATGAAIADSTLKGYLAEGSRTNLCLQSADFGTTWSMSGGVVAAPTLTANQVAAPDGTTTADRLAFPQVVGASAFSVAAQGISVTAVAHTWSVYLRGNAGGEVIYLMCTPDGATFNKTTCTLTTSWQRFELTATPTGATWYFQIGVDLRDATQSTQAAQTIYAWGAQLEVGSFASSYIPTTTAAVTRAADVLTYPTSGNVSGTAGTCYAEISSSGSDASGGSGYTAVTMGSAGTGALLYVDNSPLKWSSYDGVTESNFSAVVTIPITTLQKVVSYWGGSLMGGAVNGTLGSTAAFDGTMWTGTTMAIGSTTAGTAPLFGNIRNTRIWEEELTPTQLQGLTSPDPTQYLSGIPFTPDGQVMIGDGPIVSPISGGAYINAAGLLSVGGEPDGIHQGVGYNITNGVPIDQYAAEFTFIAPLTHSLELLDGVGEATFTRASTATCMGYAPNAMPWDEQVLLHCASGEARFSGARRISEGVWSPLFADGTAIPDSTLKGYLAEGSRQNRCLYSNVLENAAWTASNVTVDDDSAVAPDGTTTAATLTATAGNGTVIQDLGVVGSAAKAGGFYIKRKTGTGNIDLTLDNGSTWTTKTVTAAWTRIEITQTLTNEDFGIRIVTSGDAVYVWNGQVETASFLSSTVTTTSAAVTRAADVLTYPTSGNVSGTAGTFYCESSGKGIGDAVLTYLLFSSDGTASSFSKTGGGGNTPYIYDGAGFRGPGPTITSPSSTNKLACSWGGVTCLISANGTNSASLTFDGDFNFGAAIYIGSIVTGANNVFGNIRNVRIAQTAVPDSYLQYMTS